MSEIIPEYSNKKKALGRGLGSLLNVTQEPSLSKTETLVEKSQGLGPTPKQDLAPGQVFRADESKIWQMSVAKIQPNREQPRQNFDKESLLELSRSIKAHGILQPIIVRKTQGSNNYEIVAGERRWRAAQIAGLHEVPVVIKSYNDLETLELAIVENIQRQDLDPIEEAEAYQKLIEEFGLSQQDVSEKVGRDRVTITNSLRLLGLPPSVKEMVQKKELSSGHAKVLLGLGETKDILELAQISVRSKLSVRALEKLVKKKKSGQGTSFGEPSSDVSVNTKLIKDLEDRLQKKLATKVEIFCLGEAGQIKIKFYSPGELNDIAEKLLS